MKRYFILFLACFVVFGSISSIYSQEKTPAQVWSEAETALQTANGRMDALELEKGAIGAQRWHDQDTLAQRPSAVARTLDPQSKSVTDC